MNLNDYLLLVDWTPLARRYRGPEPGMVSLPAASQMRFLSDCPVLDLCLGYYCTPHRPVHVGLRSVRLSESALGTALTNKVDGSWVILMWVASRRGKKDVPATCVPNVRSKALYTLEMYHYRQRLG